MGTVIKDLREGKKLTQQELAIAINRDVIFIKVLEQNLTDPSIKTLSDICNSFSIKLSEFFILVEKYNSELVFKNSELICK